MAWPYHLRHSLRTLTRGREERSCLVNCVLSESRYLAGGVSARRLPLPGLLPEEDGMLVRRWQPDDAEALTRAVEESRSHLVPWLPWAGVPLTADERRELIAGWERDWEQGGDVIYGIFLDGQVAGGGGLHHRIGPGGLEIGYWIGVEFQGLGLATRFARAATAAAFAIPEIDRVEIHHDQANTRSGLVPERLGYVHVMTEPSERRTDAESGTEIQWRITRTGWTTRSLGRVADPG